MAKIKTDLRNLSVPELITKGQEVGAALTGNVTFDSISAKVTAFTAAVGLLVTKNSGYLAAKQTADQKLTERDNQVTTVEELFRQLASASEGVNTDAAQLESGGWTLRGSAAAIGPMPAPQDLAATAGDLEGTSDLQWDVVRGVDSYVVECASSATGPWTQTYIGKKSSCTATGLTSGQIYYFRVRAIGAAGPGPWSDIAQKRAT